MNRTALRIAAVSLTAMGAFGTAVLTSTSAYADPDPVKTDGVHLIPCNTFGAPLQGWVSGTTLDIHTAQGVNFTSWSATSFCAGPKG